VVDEGALRENHPFRGDDWTRAGRAAWITVRPDVRLRGWEVGGKGKT
jgi:hypothetical protein